MIVEPVLLRSYRVHILNYNQAFLLNFKVTFCAVV